jgi:hypothetical protein
VTTDPTEEIVADPGRVRRRGADGRPHLTTRPGRRPGLGRRPGSCSSGAELEDDDEYDTVGGPSSIASGGPRRTSSTSTA